MFMSTTNTLRVGGEQDEEAMLVALAQQSDRAAWDEIFERNYRRIYVFVFSRIGDAHMAEDLAADVFVEAWLGIRRFEYRGVPLISWLYRIARNLLADFLKKRGRSRTQPLEKELSHLADPRDEAEHVAIWQSVSTALGKLTLEQQQVLVSRFIEGLTVAETAALMGKKDNAIRALEFRALKSVRRILGAESAA